MNHTDSIKKFSFSDNQKFVCIVLSLILAIGALLLLTVASLGTSVTTSPLVFQPGLSGERVTVDGATYVRRIVIRRSQLDIFAARAGELKTTVVATDVMGMPGYQNSDEVQASGLVVIYIPETGAEDFFAFLAPNPDVTGNGFDPEHPETYDRNAVEYDCGMFCALAPDELVIPQSLQEGP